MSSASYSFLDVVALDEVRRRFAAGDALAILSVDLDHIVWANGPGAALFGHAGIETAIGAESGLGFAPRRQIGAVGGFPAIGRDRPVLVRMEGRAVPLLASAVTLPDGEPAILLAFAGANDTGAPQRALEGFDEPGSFLAFVDAAGRIEAGSPGIDRLGLDAGALTEMAASLADGQGRVAKRMLAAAKGAVPAGLARLTDEPARHLLLVVDESGLAAEADAPEPAIAETVMPEPRPAEAQEAEPVAAEPAADEEVWYFGNPAKEAEVEPVAPADAEPVEPEAVAQIDMPEMAEAFAEAVETVAPPEPGDEPAEEAEWERDLPALAALDAADSGAVADVATGTEDPEPAQDEPATGQEPEAAAEMEADAPGAPVARDLGAVRFVWRTDAEGRFSQITPEFERSVGAAAADVVGRRFVDVATAFGLDPAGEIAGLLARRDTWSGRSVLWPVAGTDLRVPVDLAALPVYSRDRTFEGFRGFGVARGGDATVDPEAAGLSIRDRLDPAPDPASEAAEDPFDEADAGLDEAADPFQGEVPALAIEPAPDRRFTDKVIRLAEHRPPQPERALSGGERIAFQQIGERLKKDVDETDDADAGADAGAGPAPDDAADEDRRESPVAEADDGDIHVEAANEDEPVEPVEVAAVVAGDEPVDHDADAEEAPEPMPTAVEPEADTAQDETAAQTEPAAAERPADDEEPAAAAADPAFGRRPSGSLLDFATWDGEADAAEEPADETPAAPQDEADEAPAEDAAPQDEADEAPAEDAAPELDAGPVDEPAEDAASQDGPEAAGRETETALLERLPVPVLVHAGDVLHHANAEFLSLTGYGSLDELADAGGIGALFADPYADGTAGGERQLRLRRRDGEEFPVEAYLRSVPWNGGNALLLVLSRVGQGLSAGQPAPLVAELEARVAEMRTIIDTATDGVVLMAPDGTIRSISRPAEALFGFDSDDVAGKPFESLFAIESQRAARDYLAGLSDNGVASVLNDGREVIGREAEGRFIPLFMTIGRLPGDSGYCAVVRDITQWKRAEEELTQARAVAERASSQKTDFLARVSHEIRTPLNAIIGFSELMVDERFGPVANDRYRDYLRDINRSGNHVLDLVNDLLDISKIEAGQQDMAYEAVSLNDALVETVAMMQPQANRERVIIRSSFASRLPDVVADLRSVRQIALNILSNAVRYTQAGGQVIVSTAYEASGDVVMRVRDTGIGMTASEIEQALKPFRQINALKRARGDGTGLGLPLTKALVEANRAKFAITSTPGEGTLVEIAFPSTRVLAE